ncbi:MAG: 30S ribosomal protein S20 [Parcubacteria group bacterium]|nr:MAG: 30S ribosomal protein S20 [Parcubacteria group bacterium]
MPNKKAAIKHLRQTVKKTARNFSVKKHIKDIIKKGDKAIADGSIKEKSAELIKSLQQSVDKAVKAGVLKPNNGNRKKARFVAKIRKSLTTGKN